MHIQRLQAPQGAETSLLGLKLFTSNSRQYTLVVVKLYIHTRNVLVMYFEKLSREGINFNQIHIGLVVQKTGIESSREINKELDTREIVKLVILSVSYIRSQL